MVQVVPCSLANCREQLTIKVSSHVCCVVCLSCVYDTCFLLFLSSLLLGLLDFVPLVVGGKGKSSVCLQWLLVLRLLPLVLFFWGY